MCHGITKYRDMQHGTPNQDRAQRRADMGRHANIKSQCDCCTSPLTVLLRADGGFKSAPKTIRRFHPLAGPDS